MLTLAQPGQLTPEIRVALPDSHVFYGSVHAPVHIADDEAVKVLFDKLLIRGPHQQRRDKLLKALDDASQRNSSSTQKEGKAFFQGLMTGYAVALKPS